MKLTRATNYAVRALVEIAKCRTLECADLRTLAREMKAPEAFLGKVLQRLKRAGLVDGTRGAHGGYRLARDAREMTVRDVVEAMEGRTTLSACLSREDRPGTKPCPRARKCGARRLWSRLEDRLNRALESETIGRLAGEKRAGSGKRR
ncbi:MAG: RrF2 family transcriptional regulator [Planctomycetota bacterium]|jgi:Rrf2 family protein